MNPIRTMEVEGRVLFRRTNGQFRPHPHVPPYTTPEERARIAARRGKPPTGKLVSRPALRLPAPINGAYKIEYELCAGKLIMRVTDPDDKPGVMTINVTGRFEDEVYEMCLTFRGEAANYMERCQDGVSPDSLVLIDIMNNPRKGDSFAIARGDYVLVAEKPDPTTNTAKPVRMAYKPSFFDRLPPLEDEWTEALNNAAEGGGEPGAGDGNNAAELDDGEDQANVED